jgi:hypothetical protein
MEISNAEVIIETGDVFYNPSLSGNLTVKILV